ncbi:MAG: hypothetical protein AAGG80_07255 [Pseudomonadota bacterium]
MNTKLISGLRIVLLVMVTILISSCATTSYEGRGTVLSATKLAKPNHAPNTGTAVGGLSGASVGAIVGGTTAAAAGAAASIATFGLAAPAVPALVAEGTLLGAAGGGAIGAGSGYVYDRYKQGMGLYQFVVRENDNKRKIIVRQYVHHTYKRHAHVNIYKKNGVNYIQPVG